MNRVIRLGRFSATAPTAPVRAVKVQEYPIDEKALANAMYVEYYLPLDPPANDTKAGPMGRGRRAQEPHFDASGNVWYTDRGIPNRVGVVDPRTAEFHDYILPVPTADPHGLTVDAQGQAFFNDQPVTLPALKDDLQQLKSDNPDLSVVVKGDDNVDYQKMVSVLDILRQLDITKVGLATE